jgi:hypothetical protein
MKNLEDRFSKKLIRPRPVLSQSQVHAGNWDEVNSRAAAEEAKTKIR